MKVLQVLPSFQAAFGGPVNASLAVHAAYEMWSDVDTVGTGEPNGEWSGKSVRSFRGWTSPVGPRFVLTAAPALQRWFKQNHQKYDLVHINLSRGLVALPLALAARRAGLPFVLQTHGMCDPWRGPRRLVDSQVTWPLLSDAKRVYVLSLGEAAALAQVAPQGTFQLLNNALVETPAPPRAPQGVGPRRVLFCARLHPRKGLDMFLRVCLALRDRGLQLEVLVAGPDEGAEQPARDLARATGMDVRFLGELQPGEVRDLMLTSDVLLHPAPGEPFGMSIIEAFARRLPVVAAASSRQAEVFLRHSAATLAQDDDVDDWSAKVHAILTDDALARRQTEAAAAAVDALYSIPALSEALRISTPKVAE